MAWPLKVYSFALLISEAETANLDTSSGEQKLGDAVHEGTQIVCTVSTYQAL